MERLRITSSVGQFVFLDQKRYDFPGVANGGVTILGCTQFSRVDPEQAKEVAYHFVDFRDIIDWEVEDHNDCHRADLQWLNNEVEKIVEEEAERKIIIFTHYSLDFNDEKTGMRVIANQKGYYIKLTSSKKGANGIPFDAGNIFSVRAR